MAIHKTEMDTIQRDYIRGDARRMASEFGYSLNVEATKGDQWRLVKRHPNGDKTEVVDNSDLPLVIYGFLLGIESASVNHG